MLHCGALVSIIVIGAPEIDHGDEDMRLASRLLAAGMLIFGAGAPAQAQQPIKIGVPLPLTGPFAKNGIENWEAVQIARDMINEKGGVAGRKIELVHGDATSPTAAISEAERIITRDGIKITTGSFASPLAIACSSPPPTRERFAKSDTYSTDCLSSS